jgi:hypothetical protein
MKGRTLSRAYGLFFAAAGFAISCALNPQPIPPGERPGPPGGSTSASVPDGGVGGVTEPDAGTFESDAASPSGADAGTSGAGSSEDASDASTSPSVDADDAGDGGPFTAPEDAGEASDGELSEVDAVAEEGDR